jgi:hypothetical protein
MSCGNRFQCGLSKPSRFQFKPDRPSNPELHNENQKRLNDLLKAREEIDKQFIISNNVSNKISENTININKQELFEDNTNYTPWLSNENNTTFTPWKVPTTSEYKSKPN